MRRRGMWVALVLAVLAVAAAAGLVGRGGGAAASAPRWAWSDVERDPALLAAFLAERAQDPEGRIDWRLLPGPARALWCTLHFELAGPEAGPAEPDAPPPPGPEQVAEAYQELGAPEAARLVRALVDDGGSPQAQRRCLAGLAPLRPRLAGLRLALGARHYREASSNPAAE